MKKLLCILCALFAIAGCDREQSNKPVVKIGVSLPLTGDMGNIGSVLKGGVEIAERDLQKQNLKYTYKFVIEDNLFEIKHAALVNQKFFSVDKVDAVIDFASKIGLTTTPVAEKNKIIHISSCASDSKVADGKYNFIHWTQTKDEVNKLVEKIVKENLNNIVIFTAIDQATMEISQNLQEMLSKHKIKFTEIRTNDQEKDFNLLVKKAEMNKPRLYVLLEYSPSLDIILKRLHETNSHVPVTSIETFSFLDDKSVIEKRWYIDAAELKSDYFDKFTSHNKSDNIYGVGNIYDAVMLLVESFERAETKETAIDELLKIKEYEGVVGKITQDENGIFNSNAVLKKVVDGKPVVVKE